MAYEIGQTCMLINIGLSRSECASWVQAWGAITALAVAGGIAVAQIRATRKHAAEVERDKQRALIEVIATLARLLMLEIESRTALVTAETDEQTRRSLFLAKEPFGDVYDAAKAMPIHELPDVEIVQLAFGLRRLTALAINVFERLVAEYDTQTGIFLRAGKPFSAVVMGLEGLVESCKQASMAREAR
ncbi:MULTISPECIES: hypothetical protein [unclassified Variovorax]|jgi:hypothetical protein|uniref:hypothetical protein n=1 Tax=unclassified Variovorax TaxID=663243 RepID=UPI000F7DD064|nr:MULTISPECIES: hypothetical protein [unclassified Variovorax]RSZ35114.1 hypothetical protein EJO70_24905 [Variovorax sp. 553]RSZ35868.1 hypothetical protein EJO71_25585 [Variovorax sp. 679]